MPADGLLYLEPSPRRIRGLLGDQVVVDSTAVQLLLERGKLPRYYFPEADVRPGLLAENGRTTVIFETAMGPRWYFPREDVRVELLEGNAHTVCAYKGHATYWLVRLPSGLHENVAWSYQEPRHDAEPGRRRRGRPRAGGSGSTGWKPSS